MEETNRTRVIGLMSQKWSSWGMLVEVMYCLIGHRNKVENETPCGT